MSHLIQKIGSGTTCKLELECLTTPPFATTKKDGEGGFLMFKVPSTIPRKTKAAHGRNFEPKRHRSYVNFNCHAILPVPMLESVVHAECGTRISFIATTWSVTIVYFINCTWEWWDTSVFRNGGKRLYCKAWRDHLQVLPVHPRTCGSRPSLSIYTHPIYPHKQHVCSYGGSLDQDLRLAITLHNSRTRLKHRLMVYWKLGGYFLVLLASLHMLEHWTLNTELQTLVEFQLPPQNHLP